jgi:hypothetical protein
MISVSPWSTWPCEELSVLVVPATSSTVRESLADLYSFQAMVWMYINAAMQQCAVLKMGGDDISVAVVKFGHYEWGINAGCLSLPFRQLGKVYG